MFLDIESSIHWQKVEPITKGWSSDQKYFIRTTSGDSLLLRISKIDRYESKKKEYEIIKKYSNLGISMSMPIEFGICNAGKNVYMLLTWIDGSDLRDVLPGLSESEQYLLGRQAGILLQKIHSIPLEKEDVPNHTKKDKKLWQLLNYEKSNVRISGDDSIIVYVKENIDQIWKQTPVYMHGDFHPGNLIYKEDGSIGVIDFNRWEVGDPYEEFYKLQSFGTEVSVPYCMGQIDAYFDDRIPKDFWRANAVYVAQAALFSIKWAETFGKEAIDGMVKRAENAFDDFERFNLTIPKWYFKDFKTKSKNFNNFQWSK